MSVIDDLRRDEGCRLKAYPDPESGAEPWTIGYGCTGPDIGPDTVWTQQRADDELIKRVQAVTAQLRVTLPWFSALSESRQAVLIDMAYQLGVAGLMEFKHTLSAVRQGDWDGAAIGMLSSTWATQTPERAHRLAEQMRTGMRA